MKDKNKVLRAMSSAIAEGRDPFCHDFLEEHDISFDDLGSLTATIAAAIWAYTGAPQWIQTATLGIWAARDVIPPAYGWDIAEREKFMGMAGKIETISRDEWMCSKCGAKVPASVGSHKHFCTASASINAGNQGRECEVCHEYIAHNVVNDKFCCEKCFNSGAAYRD